ncbi:MAG: alpha/beta fold hydrolase [Cyanobacteriota bacterium]|nr:alpha/beta fold hydrolase [Cyanobacteriota bacterium]
MLNVFSLAMGAVALAYAVTCLALLIWQTRLIFAPSSKLTLSPPTLGLSYEEVWLPIAPQTGERVHGWWLPTPTNYRGTVLYCHGKNGNLSRNLKQANRWVKLGFNVFLFDYRGYGRSQGQFPNERRVYEDAQVALNYLLEQRKIDPRTLLFYGHSLGGAVAIELATRNPRVAGLVIESSFTSLREMVDCTGIYALVPVNLLLSQRFDSLGKVASLKMPILYIHGTRDTTVPDRMSQTLFAATTAPKQLYLVPGAGHSNVAAIASDEYLNTVSEFARSHCNLDCSTFETRAT